MCASFENVEQLYLKCYIHPRFYHSKWFHYIMSTILIGWSHHTKVCKARLLKHIASDTGRKHMPHYTEKMLVLCIPDVHINYPPMMIIAVTAFPPCFCVLLSFISISALLGGNSIHRGNITRAVDDLTTIFIILKTPFHTGYQSV